MASLAASDCYSLVAAFYMEPAGPVNYQRALEFSGKALVVRIGRLGLYHPLTAESQYNLALVYRANGMLDDALREFEIARDVHVLFHSI